jgi:hypothetical protein
MTLRTALGKTYADRGNGYAIDSLMRRVPAIVLAAASTAVMAGCVGERATTRPEGAEGRAIAFLQREVPAWSRDNGCFSCHNNGDAARALFAAKQAGFRVAAAAVRDTTRWITRPDRWEHNKGDPGFSDQRLANIQFAASLLAAIESGEAEDRTALRQAARKVASGQDADGAWQIEQQNPVGSPATYGSTLATWMALRILRAAGTPELLAPAQKAEGWLRKVHVENLPNAAALLLAAAHDRDATASKQRECLALIRRAQTSDGGWGPYVDAPAEVFDTALVMLALAKVRSEAGVPGMIERGRTFLEKQQRADGSWAATTRPSGGGSYAQQMSTTGWATLALLDTRQP